MAAVAHEQHQHSTHRRRMRGVPFFQVLSAIFTIIMASNANTNVNGESSNTGGGPLPPSSTPTARRSAEFFGVSDPNPTNRVVPWLAMLSLPPSAAPPTSLSSTCSWVATRPEMRLICVHCLKRQTVEETHPVAWRASVGRASVPPSLGLSCNAHRVVPR